MACQSSASHEFLPWPLTAAFVSPALLCPRAIVETSSVTGSTSATVKPRFSSIFLREKKTPDEHLMPLFLEGERLVDSCISNLENKATQSLIFAKSGS